MRLSQDGKEEFEMNIEGDLIQREESKTSTAKNNNIIKKQEENQDLITQNIMAEIVENDEDSPSASSDEN